MNITSVQYLSFQGENTGILAIIDEKEMSVPLNPDNRHYRAILEWVAQGNTIEDAD